MKSISNEFGDNLLNGYVAVGLVTTKLTGSTKDISGLFIMIKSLKGWRFLFCFKVSDS